MTTTMMKIRQEMLCGQEEEGFCFRLMKSVLCWFVFLGEGVQCNLFHRTVSVPVGRNASVYLFKVRLGMGSTDTEQ